MKDKFWAMTIIDTGIDAMKVIADEMNASVEFIKSFSDENNTYYNVMTDSGCAATALRTIYNKRVRKLR